MNDFALPLRIEREYEGFRARVMHDFGRVAWAKIETSHIPRLDAEDDPDLARLAELLGISSTAMLNKNKLRQKLRRFAKRLTDEKRLQLSTLLGRWVPEPPPEIAEAWVLEQTRAVSEQVDKWLGRAAVAIASLTATRSIMGVVANQTFVAEDLQSTVALATAAQATRARQAASNAVLQLNTQLLGATSTVSGIHSYRWITAGDDAVREHHLDLDGTVQTWDNPPVGGGTDAGDAGHPGDGFGCRCIAEPILSI